MLFKNHTMSMITDLSLVADQIINHDFVLTAGITDQCYGDVLDASILIPPTEMLMAWADGNMFVMQNNYPRYLMECKDADDMIVALLAALTKKNVIIYIPTDEFNIFGQVFLNYMYYTYGITMNTPNTQFAFDATKLPLILSKFYMMDLIAPDEFLKVYPANFDLIPFVVNKLATELQPFGSAAIRSFNQYYEYFNNIIKQRQQSVQPFKIVNGGESK